MVEHFGGHFAPDAWPVEAIAKFIYRFVKNVPEAEVCSLRNLVLIFWYHGWVVVLTILLWSIWQTPKLNEYVELTDFGTKLEATLLALDSIGKPIGISKLAREHLLTHETWKKWMTNNAKVEAVDLQAWVQAAQKAATTPEQEKTLLEVDRWQSNLFRLYNPLRSDETTVQDLLVIGVSGRVRSYKLTQQNLNKNPEIPRRNELFYVLFVEVFLARDELGYQFLEMIPRLSSWRDLVGIVVAAHRRTPLLSQLNQSVNPLLSLFLFVSELLF